ncbi:hypothetical protein [Kutzneria sp. 744]|uniref:hypothetical protein n=1 Tax=Kutzneria sp. (strain 744) TaxID=345341 RepID=UPI0004B577E8|nr:hypothetical protein [Kutzneria sp. 744]
MAPEKSPKKGATKSRKQGAPIIAQSPSVVAGGREFVILPSSVATVPARKSKQD